MRRLVLGLPLFLFIGVASTIAFVGISIAALISQPIFEPAFVVFCSVAFLVGLVAFCAGFVSAISASRYQEISLFGVFFLAENAAPKKIRNQYAAVVVAQTIVGVAVAAQGLFSPLAFAALVPQLGFGLMAIHGGFLGEFPAKTST